jgi:hypothetical protein
MSQVALARYQLAQWASRDNPHSLREDEGSPTHPADDTKSQTIARPAGS